MFTQTVGSRFISKGRDIHPSEIFNFNIFSGPGSQIRIHNAFIIYLFCMEENVIFDE